MDSEVRQLLKKLKEEALKSQDSEIRIWLRETLAREISIMLDQDATHSQIKNCFTGAFRAICDSENYVEDDSIMLLMGTIYNRL